MQLSRAANGHLQLGFTGVWLRLKLRWLYGFRRQGGRVLAPAESIAPDYVRDDVRLMSGWDSFSGHYLLSSSEAGDEFLRRLAAGQNA